MRHLKHRNQLGVKKEHRVALMANLATALVTHGRIRTTLKKAKALRPYAEKIITLAVRAQGAAPERAIHLRRLAAARLRDKGAVRQLFNERAGDFAERPGGYTRIYKLGARGGDGAEMALIELIDPGDTGYGKRRRKGGAKASRPQAAAVPAGDAAGGDDDGAGADAPAEAAPEAAGDGEDAGGGEKA